VGNIDCTGFTEECAICRYLAEGHVLNDLIVCLVETLPPTSGQKPSMIPAFRKCLDNVRSIDRLDAELHAQLFLHQSFSGDSAARLWRRVNKKHVCSTVAL